MDGREIRIVEYLQKAGDSSSREIFDNVALEVSYATLKRLLTKLISENFISSRGNGKVTKYQISDIFAIIQPIDIESYFGREIDEREIRAGFNFSIIKSILAKHSVFTNSEIVKLNGLQKKFQENISQLTGNAYVREFERLAIDLSWKSSQIEGNTYSLLETERLLKNKETASGKSREEATMLLNHKEALDFLLDNPDYLTPLSVSSIEDIHSILVKDLGVERNLRGSRVGISGTNYRPLDNRFQIVEALQDTCDVINSKEDVFEKSLLALVLISYIQPFIDGSKRTSRIVSNAILIHHHYCPISFRTVDSIEYKKAMLLFYEQNNISNFKKIFIDQFEFAVNTYF